jgi:hypothetical protein
MAPWETVSAIMPNSEPAGPAYGTACTGSAGFVSLTTFHGPPRTTERIPRGNGRFAPAARRTAA